MVSYNVSAGVESLVFATKLVVDVGPVLELDSSVGSSSHGARNGSNLVALVAGLDFRDLADNRAELALDCWS